MNSKINSCNSASCLWELVLSADYIPYIKTEILVEPLFEKTRPIDQKPLT
jgi:hypothetical protein